MVRTKTTKRATTTDPEQSRIMRSVKSKDTKPELVVRRLLHALGFRYRLHRKDLPGKPDLIFGPRRKDIFIHGCFWHGFDCKQGARIPKSNTECWLEKVAGNRDRDAAYLELLDRQVWQAITIWECGLAQAEAFTSRLVDFLSKHEQPV